MPEFEEYNMHSRLFMVIQGEEVSIWRFWSHPDSDESSSMPFSNSHIVKHGQKMGKIVFCKSHSRTLIREDKLGFMRYAH